MSMQDPISDMLTRIRNGQAANKSKVTMPASKIKHAIAQVLQQEGYINSCNITGEDTSNIARVNIAFLL
jgi:small subunit ribosomal protein S8